MDIAICVLPDDIGPMKNGAVKSLSMQWMLLLKAHIIAKTKVPLTIIINLINLVHQRSPLLEADLLLCWNLFVYKLTDELVLI